MMMKALLVATLLVALAAASGPSGQYCGSYMGMVSGTLTIESTTSFDITLTIFGTPTTCNNEAYSYDAATGVMTIPGAAEPTNCLGAIIVQNGMGTLTATYDPSSNDIDVVVSIASLTLDSC